MFSGAPKLVTLDLHHNELDSFPAGILGSNPNIENLDLGHNRLGTFVSSAISTLSWVKYLSLEQNTFASVPTGTFSNKNRLDPEYQKPRTCTVGMWKDCTSKT